MAANSPRKVEKAVSGKRSRKRHRAIRRRQARGRHCDCDRRSRYGPGRTPRGRGLKCYKIGLGPLSMPEVATVLRGSPRTCAALGFGAAGTALSIVWWTPIIFHARGVTPFVLFIVSPGISAAVCGWAKLDGRRAARRPRPDANRGRPVPLQGGNGGPRVCRRGQGLRRGLAAARRRMRHEPRA